MTEKQVLVGCLSALGAMVAVGIGIADYRLEKYERTLQKRQKLRLYTIFLPALVQKKIFLKSLVH